MQKLTLTRPEAGQNSVAAVAGAASLNFEFEVDSASFGRSENALIIGFADGAEIIVSDFFTPAGLSSLESMVLASGELVSSHEFVRVLGEELVTGADKASAEGSGVSDYRDDGGSLMDGVDRLGQGDNLNQWGLEAGGREFLASDDRDNPFTPGPTTPEEKPGPGPEPEADPQYFIMIGHGGPVQGGSIATRIAPLMIEAPSDDASSLAGSTKAQVDVSGWERWQTWNGQEEADGPYYEFASNFGNRVLYNPETGYFGYFPDNGRDVNSRLDAPGFYYDYFSYTVLEDGAPVQKFGHVLYINDNVFPSLDDFLRNADLEAYIKEYSALQNGLDLKSAMDELQRAQENYDEVLAGQDGDYSEWDLEDAFQWLEGARQNLEEIKGYIDEFWKDFQAQHGEDLARFKEAVKDLAEALGHPELAEGCDAICQGYDKGLEIGPQGQPPLIDYEFDQAGFEEFLEENSHYLASAGTLANVTVSGTAGADQLNLSYLSLGQGSSVNLGAGDDSLSLQSI